MVSSGYHEVPATLELHCAVSGGKRESKLRGTWQLSQCISPPPETRKSAPQMLKTREVVNAFASRAGKLTDKPPTKKIELDCWLPLPSPMYESIEVRTNDSLLN